MRYILSPNIALRSWRLVPNAFYVRHRRNARGLSAEEFDLLLRCDGKTELPESETLGSLLRRGMCVPAKDGDRLSEWQMPLVCDNRYFPAINWKITEKCNYNCLHCFNAADKAQ